jgi:hypothetical protein
MTLEFDDDGRSSDAALLAVADDVDEFADDPSIS